MIKIFSFRFLFKKIDCYIYNNEKITIKYVVVET